MLEQSTKAPVMATKVLILTVEWIQHEQYQRALLHPAPPMCHHPALERPTVGQERRPYSFLISLASHKEPHSPLSQHVLGTRPLPLLLSHSSSFIPPGRTWSCPLPSRCTQHREHCGSVWSPGSGHLPLLSLPLTLPSHWVFAFPQNHFFI